MVGPDTLDYIDYLLKKFRKNKKPFGWIQMILVWDPQQLPPVYTNNTEKETQDMILLIQKYWNLVFNKARCFNNFKTLDLLEVFRQKNDLFVELLNKVRDWDLSILRKFQRGSWDKKTVHLKPFNSMVDKHNAMEFNRIKGEVFKYKWKFIWTFNPKNNITPEHLELKVGCRIMITKNLQNGLVNWDTWVVVECLDNEVFIHSDRFQEKFFIWIAEWKEIVYNWTEEVVIWRYKQIPIKLSWSVTIHKAQWLTLDNVCVTYTRNMSKELLYVWLSRCTNFDNLYLNQI